MKIPIFPVNETERLRTLRSLNILDTAYEERFDNITRLTKHVFGVPIAVVSLVDENRQWFKSCIGIPVSQTDRAISFCGHTILEDAALVVADTHLDERFSDNPLVTGEPKIRFYAGQPIHAPNGHKLGSLCIIDTVPRNLSQDEISVLKDFARLVERELAITYLATVDELTDITNRRGFMMIAQHELNRCSRDDLPASLIFFDLNKFKEINDSFGHSEGDNALIYFVKTIKEVLRSSDIFGRLGGDEFVLFLAETTSQQAQEVLKRCQNLLEQHNLNNDRGYQLTFSYGIVDIDLVQHDSIEKILSLADSLMYQNKDNPDQ